MRKFTCKQKKIWFFKVIEFMRRNSPPKSVWRGKSVQIKVRKPANTTLAGNSATNLDPRPSDRSAKPQKTWSQFKMSWLHVFLFIFSSAPARKRALVYIHISDSLSFTLSYSSCVMSPSANISFRQFISAVS